jgi:hypothetical protein
MALIEGAVVSAVALPEKTEDPKTWGPSETRKSDRTRDVAFLLCIVVDH